MKKIIIALVMILSISSSYRVEASTFGVVDMNVVMETSLAAKNIAKQIDEKRKSLSDQIDAKEQNLRKEEQSLFAQKDKMASDAFDKKREAFKNDVIEGHKLAQKSKMILDRGFSIAMNELRVHIMSVVNEITTERKYDAIFTQNSVLMAKPELDITPVVVSKLDAKVKAIKIDWKAAENFSTGN